MCDDALPPEDKNEHSSQLSSLDLYEDLLVSENQGDANRVLSMQEIVAEKHLLEEQNKGLLKQLVEMRQKSQHFEVEKQNIERNFNTLLATAKVELARKNKLLSHYVDGSNSTRGQPGKSARKVPNQAPTKQKRLLALYKGSRADQGGSSMKPASPALLQHRGEKMVGVATKVFSNNCDKNNTTCTGTSQISSNMEQIHTNEHQTFLPGEENTEQNTGLEPPELIQMNTEFVNIIENNTFESNSNINNRISQPKEKYSVELYDRPSSNGKHLLSETTKKLKLRLNEERSKRLRNESCDKDRRSGKNRKTKIEGDNFTPNRTSKLFMTEGSSTKCSNSSSTRTIKQVNIRNKKGSTPQKSKQSTKRFDKRIRERTKNGSLPNKNGCNTENSTSKKSMKFSSHRSQYPAVLSTQQKPASSNLFVKSEEDETAQSLIAKQTTEKFQENEARRKMHSRKKSLGVDNNKKGESEGVFDVRSTQTRKENGKKSNFRPELSLCGNKNNVTINVPKCNGTSEHDETFNKNTEKVQVTGNKGEHTIEERVSFSTPQSITIGDDLKERTVQLGNDDISQPGTYTYLNFHGDDALDYDENSLMNYDLMKIDHEESTKDKADKTQNDVNKSPPVTVYIHSTCEQENLTIVKDHQSSNNAASVTNLSGPCLKNAENKKKHDKDQTLQPCVQLVDIGIHLSGTTAVKRKLSRDSGHVEHRNKKRKETSDTRYDKHHNTSSLSKNATNKNRVTKSTDSEVTLLSSSATPVVENNKSHIAHSSVTPISNSSVHISDKFDTNCQTPAKENCPSVAHPSPAFSTRSKKKIDSDSLVSDLRLMLEGDKKPSSETNSKKKMVKDTTLSLHTVKTRLTFDGNAVSDIANAKTYNTIERHTNDGNTILKTTNKKSTDGKNQSEMKETVSIKSSLQLAMQDVVKTMSSDKPQKGKNTSNSKNESSTKKSHNAEASTLKTSQKHAACKKEPENVQIFSKENSPISDDSLSEGSFKPSPELNKWLSSASKDKNNKNQRRKCKKLKKKKTNNENLRNLLSSSDDELKVDTHVSNKINSDEINQVNDSYGFETERSKVDGWIHSKPSVAQVSVVKFIPSSFPELNATQHIDEAMCSYKNAALQFLLHDARSRLDAFTAFSIEEPLDLSLGKPLQNKGNSEISKEFPVVDLTIRSSQRTAKIISIDAKEQKQVVSKVQPYTDTTTLLINDNSKKSQSTLSKNNQDSHLKESYSNERKLTDHSRVSAHSFNSTPHEVSSRKKHFNDHIKKSRHESPKQKTIETERQKEVISKGNNIRPGERHQIRSNVRSENAKNNEAKRNISHRKRSSVSQTDGRNSDDHERCRTSSSHSRERPQEWCSSKSHHSNRYHKRDQRSNKQRSEKMSYNQTGYTSGRSPNDDNWDELLAERSKQQQQDSASKATKNEKSSLAKKKPRRVALERVDLPHTGIVSKKNKNGVSPPSRNLWMSSLMECQERRKKQARWSSDVGVTDLSPDNAQFTKNRKTNVKASKYVSLDSKSPTSVVLPETSRNTKHKQPKSNRSIQPSVRFQDNNESRSSSRTSVVIPELSASSWQMSEDSRAQFYSFAQAIKVLSPLKSSPGKQRSDKGAPSGKKHVRRRVMQSP